MRYVRIPLDRVGVLVGPGGSVKTRLEKLGGQVEIDSSTGEIRLDYPDSLVALKVDNIVRAIGRGFSPPRAFRLLDDDVYFELMDVHDYVGKNPRLVKRVSGRVIGTGGKTRRIIEEMTGTHLSVYGHTIGVIGLLEDVATAKKALDMILSGSPHAHVYHFLEKWKRERKFRQLGFSQK
jgi:ribosomal RNA assembly protein